MRALINVVVQFHHSLHPSVAPECSPACSACCMLCLLLSAFAPALFTDYGHNAEDCFAAERACDVTDQFAGCEEELSELGSV